MPGADELRGILAQDGGILSGGQSQAFGSLSPYTPSLRERISNAAADLGGILGAGRYGQQDIARKVGGILDFIPGVGEVLGADDVASSLGAGNWGGAALNLGALALGVVPVAGDIAAKGLKKLESRSPNLYNPPTKELRPFAADYPSGGIGDEAGNLQFDIEGRPLTASHVVGRQVVGGEDVALAPAQYDAITTGLIGSVPQGIAARNIKGNAGILTVDRRSGRPVDVFYDKSLSGDQAERVISHEIGHALDEVAGKIPATSLNDELRGVYNDLNNPQSYGKRFGPEQNRYKGDSVPRELMAEALRGYMADPNYLKTVAPKTAATIRKYVNGHPELSKIIQFNSLAGAGLLGYGASSEGEY